MAIEVRCSCGQLVYAEERFAGQNVQCPHCKASVGVPVAVASPAASEPVSAEEKQRRFQAMEKDAAAKRSEAALMCVLCSVGALLAYFLLKPPYEKGIASLGALAAIAFGRKAGW